jgi:type VI protein secretion system component VasF
MGILDKIKDTANKAAEGVQKAAESGQEKLEESKLKKKIGDLKEELGGIVFAQRTGTAAENAEAEITRIVGEIQTAEGQLAAPKSDTPDETGPDAT